MLEKALLEKIDFSKSEHYTLSIRLSADGFSFTIFNPVLDNSFTFIPLELDTNLPMAVGVRELMKSELLQYAYKRVNVLQVGQRFTLLPSDFLVEEKQFDCFFDYNHQRKANETVLCNELGKADMAVAFSMDHSVWLSLSERYPQARFYSHVSPVIEFFADKSRLGNNRKLYAYGRSSAVDIFCFERGRLLFANSFPSQQTADRAYYMLNVWKQLGYDSERDELHVAGNFSGKDELLNEIRQFVRRVFVINPNSEFTHAGLACIESIPFDLQALFLCEI